MKLSEKGQKRIHEIIDCAFEAHPDDAKGVQVLAKKYLTECDDFEIQPDDFKDCVVLTVDEAKEFKSYFDFVCNGMPISNSMWGEVHYLRNKIWGALDKSEQAESKK